ncbi:hypothetical protein D3C80_1442290 [compost metagenome]
MAHRAPTGTDIGSVVVLLHGVRQVDRIMVWLSTGMQDEFAHRRTGLASVACLAQAPGGFYEG